MSRQTATELRAAANQGEPLEVELAAYRKARMTQATELRAQAARLEAQACDLRQAASRLDDGWTIISLPADDNAAA